MISHGFHAEPYSILDKRKKARLRPNRDCLGHDPGHMDGPYTPCGVRGKYTSLIPRRSRVGLFGRSCNRLKIVT